MTPRELAESLQHPTFLLELHRLLWIEPQLNRGQRDEGWNCRDHALIVAGVAQMLGFRAALIFGHAGFVQGPRGDDPPVGLNMSPHAWVGVQGAGHYDLSVRLDGVTCVPGWIDWKVSCLAADRFVPRDGVRIAWVYDPASYSSAVDEASRLGSTKTAVYGSEHIVELAASDVARGLDTCNSLLTDWLRTEFGGRQDLHAKAILHLADLLMEKDAPLASHSRAEAWRNLAERGGDAVWRVCSRGKLA